MIANGALAVFIKRRREPDRAAIRQRTKASVEMIKARIDQLDRDDETAENVRDRAMRIDVGAEFVSAKKRVAARRARRLLLRNKDSSGNQINFVAVLFHPTREMRRFAGPFLWRKLLGIKFLADGESGVGGKDHVGQFRLRRDQLDLASRVVSVSCSPCHCAFARSVSAPRARLIHGLISYSMP